MRWLYEGSTWKRRPLYLMKCRLSPIFLKARRDVVRRWVGDRCERKIERGIPTSVQMPPMPLHAGSLRTWIIVCSKPCQRCTNRSFDEILFTIHLAELLVNLRIRIHSVKNIFHLFSNILKFIFTVCETNLIDVPRC